MEAAPPGLEIVRLLSEGPVERRFEARQLPLGRPVRAVTLASGLLPTSPLASPLRRQAEALTRLDHENVIRLFEFHDDGKSLWRIEELVDGPTLEEFVRSPLSIPCAAAVARRVGDALAHAHGRGIVHGSLNPTRVLLSLSGKVKVDGFKTPGALEKDLEPIDGTSADGIAPEVTIGQTPTSSSDLFALGSLLYFMLSGQRAFGDPTDPSYPARVRNQPVEPLLKLRPDTPAGLQQLVDRCLKKLPADRQGDVGQVNASLDEFCPGSLEDAIVRELAHQGFVEDDFAPPVGPLRRPRRAISPHVLWAGAGLILGVTAAATVLWPRDEELEPSQLSLETLEPGEASMLRVVASPWAHVVIDGVHRETTPFARPLLLAPGRHVVRFEHPNAPVEERIVDVRSGQTLLLDVQMAIKRPVTADFPEVEPGDDSP